MRMSLVFLKNDHLSMFVVRVISAVLGSKPGTELSAKLDLAPPSIEVGDPLFARVLIVNGGCDAITLSPQVLTSDAAAVSYQFRAADRATFESPKMFPMSCYINPPTVSLKAGESYAVYDVLPPIHTRKLFRQPGEYQLRAVVRVGGHELTTATIPVRVTKSDRPLELTQRQWLLVSAAVNSENVAGLGPIPKEIIEFNEVLPEGHLKKASRDIVLAVAFSESTRRCEAA